MRPVRLIALAACALALAACSSSGTGASDTPSPSSSASLTANAPNESVATVIAGIPEMSKFSAALVATGLDKKLEGKGPYTVLVPNNKSFTNNPASQIRALSLPCNAETLKKVAAFHIIPGKLQQFGGTPTVTTLDGQKAAVEIGGGNAKIANRGILTSAPIQTENGIIWPMANLIFPKDVKIMDVPLTC